VKNLKRLQGKVTDLFSKRWARSATKTTGMMLVWWILQTSNPRVVSPNY